MLVVKYLQYFKNHARPECVCVCVCVCVGGGGGESGGLMRIHSVIVYANVSEWRCFAFFGCNMSKIYI